MSKKVTPRAAMSAREVDRVQKELQWVRSLCSEHLHSSHNYVVVKRSSLAIAVKSLTRVLGMLQRSERR